MLNLIAISIRNPFKTWWKARKYFKILKTKIYFFWAKHPCCIPGPYIWTERYAKILDIHISDLLWKDKYDSPRYERPPHIFICLFRKFGVNIIPHIYYKNELGENTNGDSYYWEYLLDYLYYNNTLKCYPAWYSDSKLYKYTEYGESEDGSDDKKVPFKIVVPTVAMSLNKKGIKLLKSELK